MFKEKRLLNKMYSRISLRYVCMFACMYVGVCTEGKSVHMHAHSCVCVSVSTCACASVCTCILNVGGEN